MCCWQLDLWVYRTLAAGSITHDCIIHRRLRIQGPHPVRGTGRLDTCSHTLADTIGHDSFLGQGNPGCVARRAEIRANASRLYPAEKPQEFGDCMLTYMHTITGTLCKSPHVRRLLVSSAGIGRAALPDAIGTPSRHGPNRNVVWARV
ncbi:hypothetical protein HDV57DRAFT_150014 [Trichoderma longibrachiatum]|uniref:Uncharacterized protein n=1 Tax=Trichoderma longibrachiatum ATCC 18648 TaxID=983965 RepID=A0A2T4CAR4_TRILO|nr:hypothetical protein M440DRAFT_267333 [Trichoderma longibrachiatum ATCC 18648]